MRPLLPGCIFAVFAAKWITRTWWPLVLLRLPPGAAVLELACGKGELLAQLAEKYVITAVGVDTSPYCIRDAQAKLAKRARHAAITLLELDGAQYQPDTPESFDLTGCLTACARKSWPICNTAVIPWAGQFTCFANHKTQAAFITTFILNLARWFDRKPSNS